jgi:hypothetical protein
LLKYRGSFFWLTSAGEKLVRLWGIEPVKPPEHCNKSLEELAASINAAIG